MKILVVEDHIPLQKLLIDYLKRGGFVVDAIASGRAALQALLACRYDAMILDLGATSLAALISPTPRSGPNQRRCSAWQAGKHSNKAVKFSRGFAFPPIFAY